MRFKVQEYGPSPAASWALSLPCTVPYPDLGPTQALGWNVSSDEDRTVYRTGGGTGFVAIVAHQSREQITAALVTNQNQWDGRVVVINRALEVFLEQGKP